jgi:hypothetical protein
VGLDLVDRRDDLVVLDEVDESVRVEVRYADRPGGAVGVQLLHGSPEAVVVTERLVDQVQVDPVEAEPLERCLERALGVGLAGVLDPELGRDEQLVSRDAARTDRSADRFLVVVGRSGVDEPVANLECGGDRLLGLLRRDLEDPEAQDRHLDAVVQRDVGGHGHWRCSCWSISTDSTSTRQRTARPLRLRDVP